MIKKLSILVIFTILVVGLPLIGVYLSGRSTLLFVSFPPLTKPVGHEPFLWPVFMVYLLLAIGAFGLISAVARLRLPGSKSEALPVKRHLPFWGRIAFALLIVFNGWASEVLVIKKLSELSVITPRG